MFVFLFLCIYTNPAIGCYMNKTILPLQHNIGVWWTDSQTDVLRQHSPRYVYVSRGKNESCESEKKISKVSFAVGL